MKCFICEAEVTRGNDFVPLQPLVRKDKVILPRDDGYVICRDDFKVQFLEVYGLDYDEYLDSKKVSNESDAVSSASKNVRRTKV